MQVLSPLTTAVSNVSIYALVDPRSDEVRYIGKAVDPERRLRSHLAPSQLDHSRSHKNSWLKGLLSEGLRPVLQILETVDDVDANEAERNWIAAYRWLGARLTNGTDGGDGGAITDPAARARISAAHFGVKRSSETRAKQSASARERCADPAERERLRSISNRKPPISRGTANTNAKLTEESVKEMRRLHKEGVVGVELARRFGVTPQNVSYIVRRLAWSHVEDDIK